MGGGADKLYIVIPAYNEAGNIAKVIDEWYLIIKKIGNESKLIIIDDGSSDETYSIMKQFEMKYGKDIIGITKENSGHGATVLFGYRYAIQCGADYVFQTDSDRQTSPEEFWTFWEQKEHYKMLIGNRKNRQDGISRIFVTKVLKLVLWFYFGVKIDDANTPYRLMESETLKENLIFIPDDFALSNVAISAIYVKKKIPVKFIPISFKSRELGANSINMKKIFKIGWSAIGEFKMIANSLKA